MNLRFVLFALSAASLADAFAPSTFGRVSVAHKSSSQPASTTELRLFGLFDFEEKKAGLTEEEEEIRALFTLWNDALATGDSRIVARRYASDAVLLPTVSDVVRTDYDSIKDYFDTFLVNKPQGEIVEGFIKIGDGWAKDVGVYEFVMGKDGSKVKARYSFIYTKEDGQWKISHHHSSIMPETIGVAEPITENEVRNLFQLWNAALQTEDAISVARRYAKKAVLLPTVSDVPRTDKASITDYFTNFLKLKPSGKILESNVEVGTNWARDAGIYEFTMKATGDKVAGRYSFIYVFEDGKWKISHHHSSVMPEGKIVGQPITEKEVRDLFYRWNDALATLDSSQVAARYSKEAVLLPTVSDVPRTDSALITDYFDTFLKRKPQGVITSGDIIIGTNWAQDAGIYEFKMGDDGSLVKARYSFVYVFEDGDWKISHHHSSVMPEGLMAAAAKKAEEPAVEAEPVAVVEESVEETPQESAPVISAEDKEALEQLIAEETVVDELEQTLETEMTVEVAEEPEAEQPVMEPEELELKVEEPETKAEEPETKVEEPYELAMKVDELETPLESEIQLEVVDEPVEAEPEEVAVEEPLAAVAGKDAPTEEEELVTAGGPLVPENLRQAPRFGVRPKTLEKGSANIRLNFF